MTDNQPTDGRTVKGPNGVIYETRLDEADVSQGFQKLFNAAHGKSNHSTPAPVITHDMVCEFVKSCGYDPKMVTQINIWPTSIKFTLIGVRANEFLAGKAWSEARPIIHRQSNNEGKEKLEASLAGAEKNYEDLGNYRNALYEAQEVAGHILEGSDDFATLRSLQVAASLRVNDAAKQLTNLRKKLDDLA